MKKILLILVLLAIILGCVSCTKYNESTKIVPISFPQLAAELHSTSTIRFDFSEDELEVFGNEMPVYKIISRKRNNDSSYDSNLLNIFNIDYEEMEAKEHFTTYRCKNGDTLEIYKNGSYIYTKNSARNEIITLSDEDAVKIAQEYLTDKNILPSNFVPGKKLGKMIINNKDIVMKSVGFYNEIDGYDMYGRSDISVEISADGVSAVSSIYNDYQFDRNISCLTYGEIKQLNPTEHGQAVYEVDKVSSQIDEIVFNDVKIMYYDSPVNQPDLSHIQPVYQLIGKIIDSDGKTTDYYWTIPAIKTE